MAQDLKNLDELSTRVNALKFRLALAGARLKLKPKQKPKPQRSFEEKPNLALWFFRN